MTPYSIDTDPARRLLTIVMRGYWDQPTFERFAAEYSRKIRQMHASGTLDNALIDGREFAVQARTISDQFRDLIAAHTHYMAKRTATVVPAHLNKLQAERAGEAIDARYFTDMAEAEAWLFG
ncbi:MAG: hypothetical protein BGP16_07755 [Sphingobium sp. 66-54]|nr:MAG: hypothetical protein BGP16_07755 [Sphingobium sp. 66-54]